MDYLNRSQAPFDSGLWSRLDEAAVDAARELLTGRRFLEVEGPYGVGFTSLELGTDDYCRQPGAEEAGAILSRAISVPMLRKRCNLSIRRVEAAALGQPLVLKSVEDAAEAVARREEEFIYYGQPDFGIEGLLTAKGRHELQLSDWQQVDSPLADVVKAVTKLDASGFNGPYALALAPPLYNHLFHRYENTELLQISHLQRLCELGVYKAAIEGGVLVDARVGPIMIGQDLRVGYAAQDGIHYELFVSESLVLRIDDAPAICALTPSPATKK